MLEVISFKIGFGGRFSADTGLVLVDKKGYFYYKAKNSKSDSKKIFWRCKEKYSKKHLCPARATTNGFYIVKYLNEHDHQPDSIMEKK